MTVAWLTAFETAGIVVPSPLVSELTAALDEVRAWGVATPEQHLRPWALRLSSNAELSGVRWAELVLVEAAASGDSSAMAVLDQRFLIPAVARVARAHSHVDVGDLTQAVRSRLYVGEGVVRLRAWRGQGALSAWLRTIAIRMALDSVVPNTPVADEAWLHALGAATARPDTTSIDEQQWPILRAAFTEALRRLPRREKVALRLVVFQSLSTDQVARIFHVAPSTARRWIEGARTAVVSWVRQALTRTHGWPNSQVESLIGSSMTRELSFSGLLSSVGGPASEGR